MDNLEIKRAQLKQRDAQSEVKNLSNAIAKQEQGLVILEAKLEEAEQLLEALDKQLEGKTYIGNT